MANVALIANIADQTATTRTGATTSIVPSGVIFPYAGSATPAGWVVCDGTAYNQADYPELFAALGSAYNTQINPTTGSAWAAPSAGQFRVPDMRGLFLRGEGTVSGGDAVSVGGHQVGKTAKNGLASTFTGSSATTPSGGAHNHSTTFGMAISYGGTGGWGITGSNFVDYTGPAKTIDSTSSGHTHTLTATGTNAVTGDNETRPANRGVRYIIKV